MASDVQAMLAGDKTPKDVLAGYDTDWDTYAKEAGNPDWGYWFGKAADSVPVLKADNWQCEKWVKAEKQESCIFGEEKILKLVRVLLQDNRLEELSQISEDTALRERLCKEYKLSDIVWYTSGLAIFLSASLINKAFGPVWKILLNILLMLNHLTNSSNYKK